MRVGLVFAASIVLLPLSGASAAAQTHVGPSAQTATDRAVQLMVDECVELPRGEVDRLVAVELEMSGPRDDAGRSSGRDRVPVRVACADRENRRLRVRVGNRREEAELERTLSLQTVPPSARPRLLALAIAEMVAARRNEQSSPRSRTTTTEAARNASGNRPERTVSARKGDTDTTRPQGDLHLALIGGGRWMEMPGRFAGGAGLFARHTVRPWLGWSTGLFFDRVELDRSLGAVRLSSLALDAFLLGRLAWAHGTVLLGGGGVLAYGRLHGVAQDEHRVRSATVHGAWLSPALTARLAVPITRRWGLMIRIDGGYVTRSVRGRIDGAPQVRFDGGWLLAGLGIRLAP